MLRRVAADGDGPRAGVPVVALACGFSPHFRMHPQKTGRVGEWTIFINGPFELIFKCPQWVEREITWP